MLLKLLLIFVFMLGFKFIYCQQIAIGTINNYDNLELNEKSKRALKIAYLRSFIDGRKLDSVYIDKVGQVKYLILIGGKLNVKSKSAINISIVNNIVHLNSNTEMKTCSNGACKDCDFFTENNKVVACKCETNGSISNHCTYKINDGNYYYTLVSKLLNE
jgi:hypothetical protein